MLIQSRDYQHLFEESLLDDDSGGGENEECYDALNDETFGAAINGDWEGMHESFVLMTANRKASNSAAKKNVKKSNFIEDDDDSDLELNFARVGLDGCQLANEDTEGRVLLDPSVWASPAKTISQQQQQKSSYNNDLYNSYSNSDVYSRQQFSTQSFNNMQQSTSNFMGNIQQNPINIQPKMCTVEDIERSIRTQQQNPEMSPMSHHSMQQQQRPNIPPGLSPGPRPLYSHQMGGMQQQQQQQQKQQPPRLPPPGFSPMHINHQNQLMNQQRPMGPPPTNQMGMPPPQHNPQYPPGMHSNFGPIRPPQMQQQQHQRMPPHLVPPHFPQNVQNVQNMQNTINQFNQRLVQEIQQNHPMLSFNRNGNNFNNLNNNMNGSGMGNGQMNQMHHLNQNNMNMNMNMMNGKYPGPIHQQMQQQQLQQQQLHQQQQQHNNRHDGNLNFKEYDEYSNLMSNRDKQWLIGIQLMQLNTETPYMDDFYYTVFKERKIKSKGDRESKAHKQNTNNHPLTQPKGHAHLVLTTIGNKNGINHHHNNQRQGNNSGSGSNSGGGGGGHQNNRERKNSESSKNDKDTPRTYTPLQFENSLGKLQCGSVTAPRKIIDMDIVGPEQGGQLNTSLEISAQRKSRQLLLHIETLYKTVLKLEDLSNPTAIADAKIIKEKREKERQNALEQAIIDGVNRNENIILPVPAANCYNSSIISNAKFLEDPESIEDLLPKLIAGLTADKIVGMMTVRKGKTLVRRSLPHIIRQSIKWDVWCAIFTALPLTIKKDKEDSDGFLLAFYLEFKKHVSEAEIDDVLNVASAIAASDKKLGFLFVSKFCVLSIIALILRVEQLYIIAKNNITEAKEQIWFSFLTTLTNSVNTTNDTQTALNTALDNEILKPLIGHFSRFRDLKSQQLLAVLSQTVMK